MRCRDQPNCQYRRGACRRPNPWVEHLAFHGGKGHTRTQLRTMYRQNRPTAATSCRRARNRGGDNAPNAATLVAEPCGNIRIPANQVRDPINMRVLRRRVLREMSKNHAQRIPVNFNAANLTVAQVTHLARIIDKVYWRGTLLRAINAKLPAGRRLIFAVRAEPLATNWSGITHSHFIRNATRDLINVTIIVNQTKFGAQWHGARRSSGILAMNKLDALSLTIQHELMHALKSAICGNFPEGQAGHGISWRRLWHNYHGGSATLYQYVDNPNDNVV